MAQPPASQPAAAVGSAQHTCNSREQAGTSRNTTQGWKTTDHSCELLFHRVGEYLGPSSYGKRNIPITFLLRETTPGAGVSRSLLPFEKDTCQLCCCCSFVRYQYTHACTHTYYIQTYYTHTHFFPANTEQPAALSSGNKALSTPCTNWAHDKLGSPDICWHLKFFLVLLKPT